MSTTDEDKAIWNFMIDNLHLAEPDRKSKWELLRVEMGLTNSWATAYWRFLNHMLLQLANAPLTTESKLKLCKKYKIPISAEFLKKLQNEADVTLSKSKTVTSYKMKVATDGNRQQTGVNCSKYTPEDDQAIWDHVLENYETADFSWSFWRSFDGKSGRSANSAYQRFNKFLSMKIHEQDFDIETKLRIYQWCQFPVNEEYLKTLNDHANLKMSSGRVIQYEMLEKGRREKRKKQRSGKKPSDESGKRVKSARIEKQNSEYDYGSGNENENGSDDDEGVEFENSPKPAINQEIDNQVVAEAMRTFSGKIDTFHEELTMIKQNITEKIDNFHEKLKNISKDMGEVSSKVGSLKQQFPSESVENVEEKVPTKKAYLQKLKDVVASFNSPEMEDIQQRIDVAIQNCPDDVEDSNQMRLIRCSLDATLLMLTGQ